MNLTEEQIEAVKNGDVIRVVLPGIAGEVVLIPAEQYATLQELADNARLQDAWLDATQQAMADLAIGNHKE